MSLTIRRKLEPRKKRATPAMVDQSNWPLFVKEEIRRYGTVGYKIRSLRHYFNYSQTELAAKLGIKQNVVSRMERGSALPTRELITRLARVFECEVEMFR